MGREYSIPKLVLQALVKSAYFPRHSLTLTWGRGCVTPTQISNLASSLEGDMSMLDGYDELPSEDKERVERAISQGHIDDEDWRGDVEFNRPGKRGMHARTPKKDKDTAVSISPEFLSIPPGMVSKFTN